jgi:predicted RNase H-like HicB family nuclease
METITKKNIKKYIYWQDEDMFIAYLEEYPDYWTQGNSLEELQKNLLDLYHEFDHNNIPIIFLLLEKLLSL